VGDDGWPTVAGTGDEDGVEIVLFDEAIEVDVNEIKPGRGAPVAEKPRLHMFPFERLFEERIVVEISLADGQVIGCAPPGVYFAQEAGVKRAFGGGWTRPRRFNVEATWRGKLANSEAGNPITRFRKSLFHRIRRLTWACL